MKIKVSDDILLESLDDKHAIEMFALIDSNRKFLREWLPWVDPMLTIENLQKHITDCKKKEIEKYDYAFAIFFDGKMAGRIGIHYIDNNNKIASIGYWLAERYLKKGIMLGACNKLVDHAFVELEMNRVQIKVAVGNLKSATIAEKLHFKKEGILREGEFVNGKYLDINMYAMLRSEWNKDQ